MMTKIELKALWLYEVLDVSDKCFSWWRLWRRSRPNAPLHYLFWCRFAVYFAASHSGTLKSMSASGSTSLINCHSIQVMLCGRIGIVLR